MKRAAKTLEQFFTYLGNEHYLEGMFKLVKPRDKCLNANADYVKK
jgi:hypothetical protein